MVRCTETRLRLWVGGVVLLVMLAGCTPGDAASPTSSSASTTTAVTETSPTVTGTTSAGVLSDYGDSGVPFADVLPIPTLDPITGYGDFSGVSYYDVDWVEVTALEVQCANDQGYPVTVIPPGNGIGYNQVVLDQQNMALAVVSACWAGLHIPPSEPMTEEQVTEFYYQQVDTKACLEAEGYTVDDPPSLDTFIDSYMGGQDIWTAYNSVPRMSQADWYRIQELCPQP
ncbi:MAG: hypothetical protein GXP34_09305 [Actinobacteria bacterium]|nr:hypothetical protein [Actinomycetota bacterium]